MRYVWPSAIMSPAKLRFDRWPGPIPIGLALVALVALAFAGLDVDLLIRLGALGLIGLGLAVLVRLVLSDATASRPRGFRIAGALRGSSGVIVGALVLIDLPSLLHSRMAGAVLLAVGFSLPVLQIIAEALVRRLSAA